MARWPSKLADQRGRQLLVRRSGCSEDIYTGLYIVEVIEAGAAWLPHSKQTQPLPTRAHQLILDIELGALGAGLPGIKDMSPSCAAVTSKLAVTRTAGLAHETNFLITVRGCPSRDDVVHLKPDPRHFITNLQALKARPGNSIMVGDGALDMQAGKALNMHNIGVLTGSNDFATLQKAGANRY